MDTILILLKLDLGITHNLRDLYFFTLIESSIAALRSKGIEIEEENAEDQMLVSDYSAWLYRKRMEDVPISRNLQQRIMDRKVRARAKT